MSTGKTLPKVSYIKVSEVWFLGCTIFIFGSMVEFAFVNSIWRRKHNVPVKKLNSKHILKSTLSPHMRRRSSHTRSRSFSGSARQADNNSLGGTLPYNNYLTVNLPITTIKEGQVLGPTSAPGRRGSLHMLTSSNRKLDVTFLDNNLGATANPATSATSVPSIYLDIPDSAANNNNINNSNNNIPDELGYEEDITPAGWTTLTPQEIAIWIDRRARFMFPITFLVFNMVFWTFVYCI